MNQYPFNVVISKTGYETYTEKVSYLASVAVVKTVSLKPVKRIRFTVEAEFFIANQPELGSDSVLVKL